MAWSPMCLYTWHAFWFFCHSLIACHSLPTNIACTFESTDWCGWYYPGGTWGNAPMYWYRRRSIDRENFMVLSGPCASTGGCVTSPNHPHNYGNSESCEILAPEEPLYFTQFATEEGKDALTFGGQAYSGSAGPPQGATTSAMILWRSDAAATASGCVTSPNHPNNYSNSESCEILAPEEPLYFTQFATEEGRDVLTFDGQAYSGSAGPPQGATTSLMILWNCDGNQRSAFDKAAVPAAFMACVMSSCVASPNYPSNYGNDESCEILAPEEPLYFTDFGTDYGSRRFSRVTQAVNDGASAPPVDLRYLNRPGVEAEVATCRSDILSFLSEIYNSIAETLPDFRDDTFDVETSLEIVKPDVDTADPYSEATAADIHMRTWIKLLCLTSDRISDQFFHLPPAEYHANDVILRNPLYGMSVAADDLEAWVNDQLMPVCRKQQAPRAIRISQALRFGGFLRARVLFTFPSVPIQVLASFGDRSDDDFEEKVQLEEKPARRKVKEQEKIECISLFAGVGGLDVGLSPPDAQLSAKIPFSQQLGDLEDLILRKIGSMQASAPPVIDAFPSCSFWAERPWNQESAVVLERLPEWRGSLTLQGLGRGVDNGLKQGDGVRGRQWLRDNVVKIGGPDLYFNAKYASKLEFAQWLDQAFPCDDRLTTGDSFAVHFEIRSDMGLSGFIEPEQLLLLSELYLCDGFKTNSDMAGVERLAIVSKLDSSFLESTYTDLPCLPDAGDLLPPFSVAYVKGYRRSVTALIVAEAVRCLNILDEVSENYKALLLIQRMILDWDKLPPSLRKPWNVKDTTTLHSACAGYLHFMSVLQRKIPKADYDSSAAGLREQFLSGFLDVEILQTLESSAPKGQNFTRQWMTKNAHLVETEDTMSSAVRDLMKFVGEKPDGGETSLATKGRQLWLEFGRAVVKQKLEDKWKNLRYIAFIRDQHKDVVQMVEESVYTWLPSSVLDKFARGTEQFNAVMDFDKDLKKKWPEPNAAHQPPPPTSKGPTTDYSQEQERPKEVISAQELVKAQLEAGQTIDYCKDMAALKSQIPVSETSQIRVEGAAADDGAGDDDDMEPEGEEEEQREEDAPENVD
ncbi:Hypothetical protein (Fragment) [Durusdinium trenchii]|uniref:Uncharacterized protein n=1 Tax=Durusdinium trenchii TaxID=1381693 RepID=A0ABP0MZH3_9DINO